MLQPSPPPKPRLFAPGPIPTSEPTPLPPNTAAPLSCPAPGVPLIGSPKAHGDGHQPAISTVAVPSAAVPVGIKARRKNRPGAASNPASVPATSPLIPIVIPDDLPPSVSLANSPSVGKKSADFCVGCLQKINLGEGEDCHTVGGESYCILCASAECSICKKKCEPNKAPDFRAFQPDMGGQRVWVCLNHLKEEPFKCNTCRAELNPGQGYLKAGVVRCESCSVSALPPRPAVCSPPKRTKIAHQKSSGPEVRHKYWMTPQQTRQRKPTNRLITDE